MYLFFAMIWSKCLQENPVRMEIIMDVRCKKCLLREMPDEDMYKRVQRSIDAIPKELRCSQPEYDERLALCKKCEKLISGICRVCGCFVEFRAAKRNEKCPFVPSYWDKL